MERDWQMIQHQDVFIQMSMNRQFMVILVRAVIGVMFTWTPHDQTPYTAKAIPSNLPL